MELKRKIIIVYEVAQVAQMRSYLEQQQISISVCTFIPLEFDVECVLREQGIPYESLLSFVPIDEEFSDVIDSARSSARNFHMHAAMQFYAHKGINIGEVFEPMLDMYLEYLGRYLGILKRIAESISIADLYIPYSKRDFSSRGAALTLFEILAPVDAARAVGRQKGFVVHAVGESSRPITTTKKQDLLRNLSLAGLMFYNSCVRFCIRPRPLKIYASEYWSHIESFIESMDDVELVCMERKEIEKIPWRQLLKHRIRFVHPSDVMNASIKRTISQVVLDFSKQWHLMKSEVRGIFDLAPGIDTWPEVERALTYLVEVETERALIDIEGLQQILQQERPNKVLLRASIGGSAHHFFIATQVAHQLSIPSIELQHAGAIVDPRSVHSLLTASYIAAYGLLIREAYHRNHGYAADRIRAIGSPRFDHYVHERDKTAQDRTTTLSVLGLDPTQPVVFVAVPFPGANPLLLSSYQVAAFFETCRRVQEQLPGLQFIFKFRPDGLSPFYKQYIREVFVAGGAVVTNTSNFLPLIVASNIALTGRSTLMYEIMLGERPVILYPWQKWDTYTLKLYNGAAFTAQDELSLVTLMQKLLYTEEVAKAVARQDTFLSENYSFDGHAPERMQALLREKLLPLP